MLGTRQRHVDELCAVATQFVEGAIARVAHFGFDPAFDRRVAEHADAESAQARGAFCWSSSRASFASAPRHGSPPTPCALLCRVDCEPRYACGSSRGARNTAKNSGMSNIVTT